MLNFEIQTIQQWQEVVDAIFPHLKHKILILKGNLGAGKTTFTQFMLQKYGSNDQVSSPTYTIVNEYNCPQGKIFHFDLYRMNNSDEVFDIGMDEYLESAFLCIIEWPEIFEDDLSYWDYHEMKIDNDGTRRKITFK
jgi:tRNA threonylcarbamoyladenosine biosynthesis protein TsaE